MVLYVSAESQQLNTETTNEKNYYPNSHIYNNRYGYWLYFYLKSNSNKYLYK